MIPRPGEFGHETWENDAWSWTGDVSSWAPMSADYERGIVYIPTNPPTIDYFGGFRPGANLYGTSVIALDVKTGKRVWHFQTVHNDQWNYDLPNVPILADLNVNGKPVPAVIQTTKQGFIFTFNRATGEPVWPIEERPVPQTQVPGNWTSPTQPFPTGPNRWSRMGLPESDLIDFTPELEQEALEIVKKFRIGGAYEPRLHEGHKAGVDQQHPLRRRAEHHQPGDVRSDDQHPVRVALARLQRRRTAAGRRRPTSRTRCRRPARRSRSG